MSESLLICSAVNAVPSSVIRLAATSVRLTLAVHRGLNYLRHKASPVREGVSLDSSDKRRHSSMSNLCETEISELQSIAFLLPRTIQHISQVAGPEDLAVVIGGYLGKDANEGMEGQRWNFKERTLKEQ